MFLHYGYELDNYNYENIISIIEDEKAEFRMALYYLQSELKAIENEKDYIKKSLE